MQKKLEVVSEIIRFIKGFLTTTIVFYTILVLTATFWGVFFYPRALTFLGLEDWYIENTEIVSLGTVVSTMALVIAVLTQVHEWNKSRLIEVRHKKRDSQRIESLHTLNTNELLYLFQFVSYQTTVVEFSVTDPLVSSLVHKEIIFPVGSARAYFANNHRFRCGFDNGEPYEINFGVYNYLVEHQDIFNKMVSR